MPSIIRAGFAATDITPPVGVPMSGYPDVRRDLDWTPDAMKGYVGRRQVPSSSVHDPLLATAAALEVDGTPVVLLGLDTLVVTSAFTETVRAALAADAVPPENVLIGASHTHSGPDLFAWWEGDPAAAPAPATLEQTIAVARAALARLEEAELALGTGTLEDTSVNRRDEAGGMVDPRVTVLRATSPRSDAVLGLVVGYACHPVTLDYSNYAFSGDYVWAMREALAAVYPGSAAVFLNGAAGNINPARFPYEQRANIYIPQTLENFPVYWGGFAEAGRLGRTLAAEAIKTAERAAPVELARPTGRVVPLRLPLKHGEALQQYLDFMHFTNREYTASLTGADHLDSQVQAIDLGGLTVCALPGEVFVEIGDRIRTDSPHGPLLLVGYANDDVRYVMTDDAYVEGQYETVGTPLAAGSADAMHEAALRALAEI